MGHLSLTRDNMDSKLRLDDSPLGVGSHFGSQTGKIEQDKDTERNDKENPNILKTSTPRRAYNSNHETGLNGLLDGMETMFLDDKSNFISQNSRSLKNGEQNDGKNDQNDPETNILQPNLQHLFPVAIPNHSSVGLKGPGNVLGGGNDFGEKSGNKYNDNDDEKNNQNNVEVLGHGPLAIANAKRRQREFEKKQQDF
jgi:hypothetical protein